MSETYTEQVILTTGGTVQAGMERIFPAAPMRIYWRCAGTLPLLIS